MLGLTLLESSVTVSGILQNVVGDPVSIALLAVAAVLLIASVGVFAYLTLGGLLSLVTTEPRGPPQQRAGR